MDHAVGGKFKLGRKIGCGSFGELFLGIPIFQFTPLFVLILFFLKTKYILMYSYLCRCEHSEWRRSSYQAGIISLDFPYCSHLLLVKFFSEESSLHLYFSVIYLFCLPFHLLISVVVFDFYVFGPIGYLSLL